MSHLNSNFGSKIMSFYVPLLQLQNSKSEFPKMTCLGHIRKWTLVITESWVWTRIQIKDRPFIVPFMRIFMRRIFIKGLNLITSTSARFKKLLSPLILLNFRRNFTKCVIKCAMSIISKNPIQSF